MKIVRENINSLKRVEWLRRISEIRETECTMGDKIILSFGDLKKEDLIPEHIVSLACLVEFLDQKKITVSLEPKEDCGNYFLEDLNFRAYWQQRQDYTVAFDNTILNLWHVQFELMEDHARRTIGYLKNKFFHHKDLSAVTNSLHEAYYNIKDHAAAGGNAFSMLRFDEINKVLYVAVCDFGTGVANTVRAYDPEIIDDKKALMLAAETNFTVHSAQHNAGMGIDNIRNVCTEDDYLWIISNSAALMMTDKNERATDLGFDFKGCLLSYSISLSHFPDEETLDNFNLFMEG